MCGIRLRGENLTICPQPHPSLNYAKAAWDAPAGRIESGWRYEGDRIVLDIAVPMAAEIRLPNGETRQVEKGTYRYEVLL